MLQCLALNIHMIFYDRAICKSMKKMKRCYIHIVHGVFLNVYMEKTPIFLLLSQYFPKNIFFVDARTEFLNLYLVPK